MKFEFDRRCQEIKSNFVNAKFIYTGLRLNPAIFMKIIITMLMFIQDQNLRRLNRT